MALVLSGSLIQGQAAGHSPRKERWGTGINFNYTKSAAGATTTNNHLCRIITQADWGMVTMLIHVRKRSYSTETHQDSIYRVKAYYDNLYLEHVSGNTRPQLSFQQFGTSGSAQIHENANGGYYRDAWGRDLVASVPYYQTISYNISVLETSGFRKDQSTSLTSIYPAAFGSTASQSDADSWGYGRGVWFNSEAGTLEDN